MFKSYICIENDFVKILGAFFEGLSSQSLRSSLQFTREGPHLGTEGELRRRWNPLLLKCQEVRVNDTHH